MATVKFDKPPGIYPGNDTPSRRPARHRHRRRGVPRPRRSLRVWQVHLAAHARRPRRGQRRQDLIGDRDVTDLSPKDRDVAMVFQNYALYPHMTVADNMGFALKIAGVDKGEIRKRVERGRQDPRPHRLPRPQAEGPLRWPAPARRHGPRDRPLPPGVPHGRAAVEPRRQAARADPHPDRVAPAPTRRHHGLRHARPDRGHDDGRPHRGAEGRHPAAVRHPARDVRPPEQRVRRRLHRLPRHEPRLGARHRGRRAVRQPPAPGRPRAARQGRQPGHRRHAPRGRRGHDERGRPRADRRRRRGARRRRLRLRHPGQRPRAARGRRRRPRQAVHRPRRRPQGARQGVEDLRLPQRRVTCTCSTPRAAPASADAEPLLHATPRTSPSGASRHPGRMPSPPLPS